MSKCRANASGGGTFSSSVSFLIAFDPDMRNLAESDNFCGNENSEETVTIKKPTRFSINWSVALWEFE